MHRRKFTLVILPFGLHPGKISRSTIKSKGVEKMEKLEQARWTAFEGFRCIASGELAEVAVESKKVLDQGERAHVLIFDDLTGEQIDVDLRGSPEDVLKRLPPSASRDDRAGVLEQPGPEGPRARTPRS